MLQPVSGTSSWQQAGESSPYDTSLSYYESARGTGGRGTPPPREHGQPRLDDLFRQLQVNTLMLIETEYKQQQVFD